MNKIEFPRIGVDGHTNSIYDISSWYITEVETNIKNKLNVIPRSKRNQKILDYITQNLKDILLAEPQKLQTIINDLSNYQALLITKKNAKSMLNKKIYQAFAYESFRKTALVDLAAKLNVKTCPYCNMHYTLYAEKGSKKKQDRIAKMQFDHFYDKKEYPYLSMSLYNLIPSCGVCNQGKSTGSLSMKFHPYECDIQQNFKFEIANPIIQLYGGKVDTIDVKLKAKPPVSQAEVDEYAKMFNLVPLYSRHKDIAQETFDKAYEDPYYNNPGNFSWLKGTTPGYIKRLWLGTYINNNEIEKRPMTKFIQDLWDQAKDIKATNPMLQP